MHIQNLIIVLVVIFTNAAAGDELGDRIESQLAMAGGNKSQIERALVEVLADQRPSMRFLVAWMHSQDLRQLTADRLLENVAMATQVRTMTMWQHAIPDDIFNNFVLPHACLDEPRDPWRSDFYQRFWPLVKDSKSASEAAQALNQRVFQELNVKYSTDRRRANQSPAESIKLGLASCSGLSIILVDACRSVGVPARIAGIPKWANKNGNHTWVEVWDNGWHFTGAAEYDSRGLDHAWFTSDAALADSSSQLSSIYSVKYEATGIHFPLTWSLQDDSIHAVNVTERYVNRRIDVPKGFARILFSAKDSTGKRIALA
ncbi:MAG: transglutaminase-like domain-containing protein, partial [Planctomycetota bacterium]|nr:transglutaminase-like domain-containing protein [Planctomycetota bacterium]